MDLVERGNFVVQHHRITARLHHQRFSVLILKILDLVNVAEAADADEAIDGVLFGEARSLELLHSTHLEFVVHLMMVFRKVGIVL